MEHTFLAALLLSHAAACGGSRGNVGDPICADSLLQRPQKSTHIRIILRVGRRGNVGDPQLYQSPLSLQFRGPEENHGALGKNQNDNYRALISQGIQYARLRPSSCTNSFRVRSAATL